MSRTIDNGGNIMSLTCDHCGLKVERVKVEWRGNLGPWTSHGALDCAEWMTLAKGFLLRRNVDPTHPGELNPATTYGELHPIVQDFCPSCATVMLDLLMSHGFITDIDLEKLKVREERCTLCYAEKGAPHYPACSNMLPPWRTNMGPVPGPSLGAMMLTTRATVMPMLTVSTTSQPLPDPMQNFNRLLTVSTTSQPLPDPMQNFNRLLALYNLSCDACGHDYAGHSTGGGSCPCGCEQYAPPQ